MPIIDPPIEVVEALHERLAALYPSLQGEEVFRTVDFSKSKSGEYEAAVCFYHGQSTSRTHLIYRELKDDKGRPYRRWCTTSDWMD